MFLEKVKNKINLNPYLNRGWKDTINLPWHALLNYITINHKRINRRQTVGIEFYNFIMSSGIQSIHVVRCSLSPAV